MMSGHNRFKTLSGALVVAGMLVFFGMDAYGQSCCGTCGGSKSAAVLDEEQGNTIVDLAAKAGTFNTLVTAVKAAGLKDTLRGKGPFTVFAPSDEAFAKIPKKDLEDLLKPENRKKLAAILTYHVVPNEVLAGDVVKLKSAKTVNGQSIKIQVKDKKVFVDNAQVVKTDIKASNGVIHVINSVIMPDFRKDIVDTAVENGSFRTLVAAVKAAGLVDTLKGEGPFTVFAPTDEAFGKLSQETLKDLLKPENKEKLKAILTYHVLSGEIKSDRVIKSKSVKTVNGQSLGIQVRKGSVYLGDARVVKTDITARNGVIHVIDTVLIPQ
jgi:uncharacterized surface protein with fasciclin (FAS1) repeats